MGKRTLSLPLGQAEQRGPAGLWGYGREADGLQGALPARGTDGPGDTAQRLPGCRGHGGWWQRRSAGQGWHQQRPVPTAGQGPAFSRGSLSHTRMSGTAHSPCPAHAVTRHFEHTGLQETLPCSFPSPQTSREWGKHIGKTHPYSVFPSLAAFKDSFLFLHLQ